MEIIKEDSNKKEEMVEVDITYEWLDEELEDAISRDFEKNRKDILGKLVNLLEIGRNAKKIINPKLDYVVKFTPELINKMQDHDIQFLRDKITGELLPDLYDYTDKHIGGKVRLELKGMPNEADLTALYNSVNNYLEHKRYDTLIEEIQQLQITARRIERGQDNDRFAKVNAGRNHLIDALNYEGPEDEKKKMVFDALAMLREGRELIEKTLLDFLENIEYVPEGTIKRWWTVFWKKDYFYQQTKKYEDIQEYFQYYIKSMQPMAYAFIYLEQPKRVEALIKDSQKVFQHERIEALRSVEYLLPDEDFEEMWYNDPQNIEKRIKEAYTPIDNEKDILIRITGKELLEAFDGKE